MIESATPLTCHHKQTLALGESPTYHITHYRDDQVIGYLCLQIGDLRRLGKLGDSVILTYDGPREDGAYPISWFSHGD